MPDLISRINHLRRASSAGKLPSDFARTFSPLLAGAMKLSYSKRMNDITPQNPAGGLKGLVMTGGGARGAYQAGVLKRIGESKTFRHSPSPFKILAGASAGAINVAAIATHSRNFGQITRLLSMLWSRLTINDIFRTDLNSLSGRAVKWLQDLTLGGALGGGRADSLLDASPLQHYLAKHLRFPGIETSIREGHLYGLAITATNYHDGRAFTFLQGQEGHPTWRKSRRLAFASHVTVEHICASAAIPILFQPVQVNTEMGSYYFGDGCLRLHAPLSPAIRLGAKKILAIGVRSQAAVDNSPHRPESTVRPPLAQVLGVALNAIFLDHLDSDVEHLMRVNSILESCEKLAGQLPVINEPMQIIRPLIIRPSVDIASIAETHAGCLPLALRYFLDGLGTSRSQSSDLISYLLFESEYTRALIDLGYRDAHSQMDEIEGFLTST